MTGTSTTKPTASQRLTGDVAPLCESVVVVIVAALRDRGLELTWGMENIAGLMGNADVNNDGDPPRCTVSAW